ncbi:heparinase II/III family protein [Couchioplanes caeruleus]|uniref:alginate lyase family protein n=1 Tax=Couchioplanes caeruleus TaxID=56438 RepID=UPI0020BF232D|nr:alginate lyase family protein [Couchioplanes caeruleus]UQU65800.1 heparinase II/III family protein [Couchioplanes caeruleus]
MIQIGYRAVLASLTSVVLLTATGCDQSSPPDLATAVRKPAASKANQVSPALPSGRESIYSLVNVGSIEDADALLRNVWKVPRFKDLKLPNGPAWTEDPYGEKYWRFYFYSLRPTACLLWAYFTTGRTAYLDKLIEILRSYVAYDSEDHKPDRDGMDDPHAMAFRAMVLVNTFWKLKRSGVLPEDLEKKMLRSVERIAIELKSPTNFQGGYNHGFTEALALLLISVNFPDSRSSAEYGSLARGRIEDLIRYAIDPDGVENEKSPFYHFYVFDFMVQTEQWAKANRVDLPKDFSSRLRQMIRYSTEVIWPDGSLPLLGSSVEARPAGSRTLYEQLIKRFPDFAFAVTAGQIGTAPTETATLFPASGQAILRSPATSAKPYSDNSQILMDVGPPTSPHAHDEPLAILYYSHGRELLVDSGLDTYSSGEAYNYFHGITAHNTVTADRPTKSGGWVKAGLTVAKDGWSYQSGVASVYQGVTHRRSVLLLDRDIVLVFDDLVGHQARNYEQLWHLFPGARVLENPVKTRVLDEYDNPALTVQQSDVGRTAGVRRYRGEMSPMQGWYSAEYGKAEPNNVVGFSRHGRHVQFVTVLTSGRYASADTVVRSITTPTGVQATLCVNKVAATAVIENQARTGERVSVARSGVCGDGN